MRIVVLSDNKVLKSGLVAKHSLSILVELGFTRVLFDMGIDYDVLEHNSGELGVDLALVDYVVVSHEHVPHYGGYKYVAQEAPYVKTLIPYGTMESLGSLFRLSGLRPFEVSKWTKLGEGIFVTPPHYGPPYEHFLVLNASKGLVVVSGCMHPGVKVLRDIKEFFNREVYAVIGGFHMQNAPSDLATRYARFVAEEVKPGFVVPLHCSGARFAELLRGHGIEVLEGGAGLELTI